MFDAFPRFSLILWISITVLENLLAIMLFRWDAWKRYPVMSFFVTWQAVGGLTALLISRFGPPMLYFYVFYVVTFFANVIMFAVALELYYSVFDPRIGFFAWGRRHVVIMISVSLCMATSLGFLLTARNGGSWTRAMVTMEQITSVALWTTFCILLIYSRSLGFTWPPRSAGIATGFILYLPISVISIFIRARLSLGAALIAGQVGMAAYFLTLAWWLGVFWEKEKLPEATIPEVEEVVTRYKETVEAAARLL
ncbi:MAG TPA: hypothetical protein VFF39_01220 [Verrucomicrobiae bacterium]|nr:hypothetical protein [Verrucomicrobiae bacterium]